MKAKEWKEEEEEEEEDKNPGLQQDFTGIMKSPFHILPNPKSSELPRCLSPIVNGSDSIDLVPAPSSLCLPYRKALSPRTEIHLSPSPALSITVLL